DTGALSRNNWIELVFTEVIRSCSPTVRLTTGPTLTPLSGGSALVTAGIVAPESVTSRETRSTYPSGEPATDVDTIVIRAVRAPAGRVPVRKSWPHSLAFVYLGVGPAVGPVGRFATKSFPPRASELPTTAFEASRNSNV